MGRYNGEIQFALIALLGFGDSFVCRYTSCMFSLYFIFKFWSFFGQFTFGYHGGIRDGYKIKTSPMC